MAMELADFDAGTFLRDYWQKKPLLIRNPWKSWRNPLDPDELAGLACESEVESRLIMQSQASWDMEQGPLAPDRFIELGARPWTLLVQAVDHHVPEVAALLEQFRFIPNWRVDDVMVSYAVDHGGVGPHFDQYDVFLVQGLGRRRWQIGGFCDEATELLPHDDLRLLARFDPVEDWILEPGDILYVPPRLAHNGIAVGSDCMTYSIGFRAPSREELIVNWSEHVLEGLDADDRYADPDLPVQANPGEIAPAAIARLHALATGRLLDSDDFARWFGEYSTTPKYPEIDWRPEQPVRPADLRMALGQGVQLVRNPASRFAYITQDASSLLLFVNGQCFECRDAAASFAGRLCRDSVIPAGPELVASAPTVELIAELLNQGWIAFDEGG
jgi:50S ribosomal protein L16 3-hydroxylase